MRVNPVGRQRPVDRQKRERHQRERGKEQLSEQRAGHGNRSDLSVLRHTKCLSRTGPWPVERGFYIITNLSPSIYSVVAISPNLSPREFQDVTLSVGQERTLNITLQPATVATEVTVEGGALTQVDTSSASIGANVNAREVGTL